MKTVYLAISRIISPANIKINYPMNRKVFVTGDISTRDKLKLTGFIDGFSKISETTYLQPRLKDRIEANDYYDVIFGESGDWCDIEYTNIGNVFMWCVIDPNTIRAISEKYPDTNFYICSKSLIHDIDVTNEYIEKYGTSSYMKHGMEGVDIREFSEVIANSEKIDNGLYKITQNLFYLYLPCSLVAENLKSENLNKDIDITYFGTRNNRPGVSNILNWMETNGYNVVYNRPDNYISPEECIEYYKRSIITIHEQVGPVYLEFPVRFGEASYYGSKIFSLDIMKNLEKYAKYDPNIPEFRSFKNTEDLIDSAVKYIGSYRNGVREIDNKDYTYEFYCKKILQLSR
jgi:hypothetical protein